MQNVCYFIKCAQKARKHKSLVELFAFADLLDFLSKHINYLNCFNYLMNVFISAGNR